jgi:hypothetical protein
LIAERIQKLKEAKKQVDQGANPRILINLLRVGTDELDNNLPPINTSF